jgi:hypothetical protein
MTSDNPRRRITKADAAEILGYLFAVQRRNDKGADAASWLTACTEMITDTAIAQVIGVKPLPQHPAVLGLAIKKIVAEAIFPSVPSEVAKAMHEVHSKILLLRCDVWPLLKMARDAERIVFKQDREAWASPYVSGAVPSSVAVELVDYGDDSAEWWTAVEALFDDDEEQGGEP